MNYIKALKIYNDRKGEKNEWCVYKKGTSEYLKVMKIMKDFKEKPIKEKAANVISNAIKIRQAKKELEKLKLEKPIKKEKLIIDHLIHQLEKIKKRKNEVYKMITKNIIDVRIKNLSLAIDRNISVIEYCIMEINDKINQDISSYINRANSAINLSFIGIDKLEEYLKTKPIKEKAVNVISNNFKIKQAKQELEKLKLEKAKKELKKNNYLDDILDILSLEHINKVLMSGKKTQEEKEIYEQLKKFYEETFEIKMNILRKNNYEDFIKLKNRLENIYIDIDKLEEYLKTKATKAGKPPARANQQKNIYI
jgi:hypothetical protein